MKRTNQCIVCGNTSVLKFSGSLAPFISHYVFDGRETEANLVFCPRCQMMFSDARFEDQDMERLYLGYRGSRYCDEREKYEPGYGKINREIAANDYEIVNRMAFCTSLLSKYLDRIKSVLDFGGDRGQFIPTALRNARQYVYEVSGVKPLAGVESLSSANAKAPYDLVMCCHVLEHVPSPLAILQELRTLLSPHGLVYVELPAGIPTRRYFEATLARNHIGGNRPIRFHEHINAFTKASLRNALLIAGFRPLVAKIALIEFGWTQAPILSAIAVPASSSRQPKYGRMSLLLEGIEYGYRRNFGPAYGEK